MEPRTVLVTGGSNGIGRSTVERFARGGDRVWFTYRFGRERAQDLIGLLASEAHDTVEAFEFDQGDEESHARLLAALPGPVDILVNNAAVGSKTVERHAADGEHARDAAMFRINCLGPLWLTQELLPGMLERGFGKIVTISSVSGGIGQFPRFRPADGMSKSAVAFLSRQLAVELALTPVDVFAVCPGAVETDMFEASTLSRLSPDERARLVARLPKGRLIQPGEIAELVWWLCGPAGQVMHGAVLDASMGLGVHPGLLTGES